MNDLLWNTRLLEAMKEHAFLTDDEVIVLNDWARGKSIANTSVMHHMSESTVNRIRKRLRQKYDGIQGYASLPPRK